jgi:alpha-L-rhamnosidase
MKKTIAIILFFAGLTATLFSKESFRPENLLCENLSNPLAIDNVHPHFSWKNKACYLKCQSAFEIQVGTDSSRLSSGIADLWASGKVTSAESVMVPYEGRPLQSRKVCYWRVRVWNEEDKMSDWSIIRRFTIGILDGSLKGDYISKGGGKTDSPILRKSFNAEKNHITFLHICSLGYHEAYLNGEKIGNAVLSPAVSQLDKRALITTYDVTDMLKSGENELVIWLGKGWYKTTTFNAEYDGPVVKAELSSLEDNGQWMPVIITDTSWLCRESGYSDTGAWKALQFGGERIDASQVPVSMSKKDLDMLEWNHASKIKVNDRFISPQTCSGNKIHETVSPVSLIRLSDDEWLVDMGKVVTGWFQLSATDLERGHQLTVHYSDYRKPNGEIEEQGEQDIYLSSGRGKDVFCNKFNHHAFRYVRISKLPYHPNPDDIRAYSIYEDFKPSYTFVCSDNDMNEIYNMINYTIKCLTFSGYMVDCPHLERTGYGGDGNSSTQILQTMFDADPLFLNWLQAWVDVQKEDGGLPHVAPAGGGGGGPYWCGFIVLAPWRTYLNYGDPRLIYRTYSSMKKWMGYVDKYIKDGLLKRWPDTSYRDWYLGDWLAPEGVDSGNQNSVDLVNNCFLSECLGILTRIASFMGEEKDAEVYEAKRIRLNARIHSAFFNAETCLYGTGSQIDMAYPLLVGAVPDSLREKVTYMLKTRSMNVYNGHIGVGLVGVPILTQWAIDNKEVNFFYSLLKKQDYPGYLFMIRNGATTTWESWDAGRSHVHNCYNGVGNWFCQAVGGIRLDAERPYYKNFFIEPQIPYGISWAESTKETPYGTIIFNWQIEDNHLKERLSIPSGTTATVIVPSNYSNVVVNGNEKNLSANRFTLSAGTYDLEFYSK